MKFYPEPKEDKDILGLPLQSILFGHRLIKDQTISEYLLEFLQVVLSKKQVIFNEDEYKTSSDFFPIMEKHETLRKIEIFPQINMGLRRFIFFDRSKKDTQAPCDFNAFNLHKELVKQKIYTCCNTENTISKDEILDILQELLYSFSGILSNRSWCAQSLLPICESAILPEAMPKQTKRKAIGIDEVKVDPLDTEFEFNQYNFMARGGEVYYLHVLRGLNQFPEYRTSITLGFSQLLSSFPQLQDICKFIQGTWEDDIWQDEDESKKNIKKSLSYIPTGFDSRNEYTLKELNNFLSTDMHPFEKIEILSQGIILQILRMQFIQASIYNEVESPVWVIDMTDNTDNEVKKHAIYNFASNEENIINAYNKGFIELVEKMQEYPAKNKKMTRDSILKDADEKTIKVYRRLGKEIGLIIPIKGAGMRFTLSETLIKFLVISIIEPGKKLTIDTFIERLYEHYGIIINSNCYDKAIKSRAIEQVSDKTFLHNNEKCFIEKLKNCGFLRDLSDATAIVENPYLCSLKSSQ